MHIILSVLIPFLPVYRGTYLPYIQLPFLDCIENRYSVLLTVLTAFGHFWTCPLFFFFFDLSPFFWTYPPFFASMSDFCYGLHIWRAVCYKSDTTQKMHYFSGGAFESLIPSPLLKKEKKYI